MLHEVANESVTHIKELYFSKTWREALVPVIERPALHSHLIISMHWIQVATTPSPFGNNNFDVCCSHQFLLEKHFKQYRDPNDIENR